MFHALPCCPAGAAAGGWAEAQGGHEGGAPVDDNVEGGMRRMSLDEADPEVCVLFRRLLRSQDCAARCSAPAMRCVRLCRAVFLQHCM
jgi:hypothetical protein